MYKKALKVKTGASFLLHDEFHFISLFLFLGCHIASLPSKEAAVMLFNLRGVLFRVLVRVEEKNLVGGLWYL